MLKSDFSPMVQSSSIDTIIDLIKQDINMLKISDTFASFKHTNITKEEIQVLDELPRNGNITIKPAHKGGGVVNLNTSDYIAEATRQLMDKDVYRLLSGDPRWDFERKLLGL